MPKTLSLISYMSNLCWCTYIVHTYIYVYKYEKIIYNATLISSKYQPPNLKTILTKAACNDKPFKHEVTKCGNKKCGCCKFVQTTNSFFFHRIGQE